MENPETTNTRKAQAYATKRKLLESAGRLFAKNGYSATSVRSINREINLADGLLYHYFPNGKKEIFQVLVKEKIEDIMKQVREKNSGLDIEKTPIRDILFGFFEDLDLILMNNSDIIKIILRENEVRSLIDYSLIIEILSENRAYIENLLKKKEELKEVVVFDYPMATELLFSLTANSILCRGAEELSDLLPNFEKRNEVLDYLLKLWKRPLESERKNK